MPDRGTTGDRAEAYRLFLAGEPLYRIEKKTGVPRGTVQGWKRGCKPILPQSFRSKPSPDNATISVIENTGSVGLLREVEDRTETSQKSIVLAVPDLHCPFQHVDSLAFLRAVKSRFKPNTFVCLGDEADFAAFSRFIPDPDGLSPGKELEKAIEALIPFYLEFPRMLVCESNHTVRPLKKMFDAGLPAAFLPTYAKMLNAPDGWVWKQYWEIDGVRYHHGDSGRSGQFAPAAYLKAYKQSHVHGHLHGFASVMREGEYFGVNAGCLIDPDAYAFKYARNHPVPVNLGCALIINGKSAHFLPMLLDKNKRWIGTVY